VAAVHGFPLGRRRGEHFTALDIHQKARLSGCPPAVVDTQQRGCWGVDQPQQRCPVEYHIGFLRARRAVFLRELKARF